jgi:hypothetical protein
MQAEGLHKAVGLDLCQPQGAQVVRPRVAWGERLTGERAS